eukprot:4602523-Amphidinium_carterae.1
MNTQQKHQLIWGGGWQSMLVSRRLRAHGASEALINSLSYHLDGPFKMRVLVKVAEAIEASERELMRPLLTVAPCYGSGLCT